MTDKQAVPNEPNTPSQPATPTQPTTPAQPPTQAQPANAGQPVNSPAPGTAVPAPNAAVQEAVPPGESVGEGQSSPLKSVEEVAKEVREGKWGVRKRLQQNLVNAGYNYKEVQKELHKK